jgi:fatty-acyl-CoA synthase
MKNWFDHILFQTRANPEKPAIVMEDRVVTYGMLRIGIENCARRIVSLNIPRNGLVAVTVKNPIRHLTLCLALFRIGMPSISVVQGQPGADALTFSAMICDSGAARIFLRSDRHVIEVGDEWFGVDLAIHDALPPSFAAATQLCRVSLTSGSTGAPKIVNDRVQDIGWRILKFLEINWNFALCMPGITSNWGFANSCATLTAGRTLCLAESPFQAIRMIELFSIDFAIASTEQLLAMTRAVRKSGAQLKSLRTVWASGSTPTRVLLESAMIYLCRDILCLYAASETGVMAQAMARDVLARPGLVGHIRPGIEVAIFDQHGGRCRAGAAGAVRMRHDPEVDGPSSGGDPATRPWIDTGDVGWIAPDGQLFVVGRTADPGAFGNRISATPQVSPAYEVEHLLRLEWDATDAAAVMIDDSTARPEIWIGIVDNSGANAEKLSAMACARGIEHAIRLFDLPAIPRGPSGKVNRGQLKALMMDSIARRDRA